MRIIIICLLVYASGGNLYAQESTIKDLPPRRSYGKGTITFSYFEEYEAYNIRFKKDSIYYRLDPLYGPVRAKPISELSAIRVSSGNYGALGFGGGLLCGLGIGIGVIYDDEEGVFNFDRKTSGTVLLASTGGGAFLGLLIGLASRKWNTYYPQRVHNPQAWLHSVQLVPYAQEGSWGLGLRFNLK